MQTKCAAFWNHTNIRSDNRVFPCCRFKTPVAKFNGNVQEVLFYPEYDELRKRSENNEFIEGCSKCYHEESLGKPSLRQKFNDEYSTDSVGLKFLEIGFDNICNLTCDGCWSEFSSAWARKSNPDADKHTIIKSSEEIVSIPNTIERILFLGGEPLMTNRHKRLLEMIEDPGRVSVTYNTNGTFLLSDALVALLEKFKQVDFILSIDGYGELNEQVRSGSSWTDILKFIEQIKQLKFGLTIHTVVHKNNWQGLTDLANFVKILNVPWTTNVLTYPAHLDISGLEDKSAVVALLESIEIPNKEYILRHLTYENINS